MTARNFGIMPNYKVGFMTRYGFVMATDYRAYLKCE